MPLLFSGCCFGLLWLGPPAGIFPARLPGNRLRPEMSPYRARFRSDINAAVLTLQNTQRKDRRFYTALTGSHLWPQPVSREPGGKIPAGGPSHSRPKGSRRTAEAKLGEVSKLRAKKGKKARDLVSLVG